MKEDKTQKALEDLAWVEHLPDTNIEWSKGILDTAWKIDAELAIAEEEKAKVDKRIKGLRKMLLSLPSRANREALLLYSEEEIVAAKNK